MIDGKKVIQALAYIERAKTLIEKASERVGWMSELESAFADIANAEKYLHELWHKVNSAAARISLQQQEKSKLKQKERAR